MNSKEIGNLSDRELLAELRAYERRLAENPASLNLTADDAAEVKDLNDSFEESLDEWDAIQPEKNSRLKAKNAGRKKALAKYRSQRNKVYAAAEDVSNSDLAAAGFPLRDKTRTKSPSPSSAPFGWIEYMKLTHKIHYRDANTPNTRAKPKGMRGCEIWYYIGDAPPTSEKDYRYLTLAVKSPRIVSYDKEDAGKMVRYLLRWLSKNGDTGGWSEIIEATING